MWLFRSNAETATIDGIRPCQLASMSLISGFSVLDLTYGETYGPRYCRRLRR